MAKNPKEWKVRTIAEFHATKSTVWRAQLSVAPDGTRFAGVKKFIVKADGKEIIADRAGLNFVKDESLQNNLDGMLKLLKKLKQATEE
jgi:hypothetical protein